MRGNNILEKFIGFLLFVTVLLVNPVYVYAAPEWRQFRRDFYRTAATSEEIRNTGDGKSSAFAIVWSKEFAEFPHENAHIIIADGISYYSLMDGTVRAISATANSYQELWSKNTGASLNNAPAAYDGRLYLVNLKGHVMSLSGQTGQTLWEYTVNTDVYSPPLYVNGRIYFGGINGILYCFDAENGGSGPVWTFTTPNGMIDSAPVYQNGKIIFSSENMKAYALNWKTGAQIWVTDIAGDKTWNGSPVVARDANRVVFQTLSTLRLNANNGTTYRDVCDTCPGKYDVGSDPNSDWSVLSAFDQFISTNRPSVNTNVVLDTETGQEIRNFSYSGQTVSLLPFTSMYWNSIRWSIINHTTLYAEANRRSWLVNLQTGAITSPKWYGQQSGNYYFVRGDENVLTIVSGNRIVGGIRRNLAAMDFTTAQRYQLQGEFGNQAADAMHINNRTFSTPHYQTHPGDGFSGENSELIPYRDRVFYMDNGWLYAMKPSYGSITDINTDTQSPSKPIVPVISQSNSQNPELSWTASADNVKTTGYRIYRDGIQIATTQVPEYVDIKAPGGQHAYQVSALDWNENESVKSDPVNFNSTNPTILPTPTLISKPGDANGDGKVDGVDYVIWLNHYGQTGSGPVVGDFNSDGKIDGVDYVIWLNNYGV